MFHTANNSNDSSENLARSVVDIQLREQLVQNQLLVEENGNFKSTIYQLNNTIGQLMKNNEITQNEIKVLQTENKSLMLTCEQEHIKKFNDLENMVAELRTSQDQLNQLLQETGKQLASTENERDCFKNETIEYNSQINRLNELNNDLNVQIQNKELQINSLNSDNKELIIARSTLEQNSEKLNSMIEDMANSLEDHKCVKLSLEENLALLNEKVLNLETHKASLMSENREMYQKLPELNNSLKQLQTKLDIVKQKKNHLEDEKNQLTEAIR